MTETTRYKVERVAQSHGLDSIGDELVEGWTRENDAKSLRELAAYFNERVLETAMEAAGVDSLDGEVENTYRLLSDDDVSSGVRTETRKRLQRNGVDVEKVESEFVTYQAIRTYLQDGRGVTREKPTDEERVESVDEAIKRLRNRTTAVTEEKLRQLRDGDRVNLGEFRVLLDLRAFCEDCGTQYEVDELLERGGCACSGELRQRE